MKTTKAIVVHLVLLTMVLPCMADGVLRNASAAVSEVSTSLDCPPSYVDEWYFPDAVATSQVFMASVAAISNNWQSITNEWPAIRDNYDMRVMFRNLAGFAGTNAFLGILSVVVDDARTNAVSRKVVVDTLMASRTPLWMFVPDHYDLPCVSNLLERVIPLFPDDEQRQQHYRSVLSGEYKRHLDEERACGAIEY